MARLLQLNLIQETLNHKFNNTAHVDYLNWSLNILQRSMLRGTFSTTDSERVRGCWGRDGVSFICPDKIEPQSQKAALIHVLDREIFLNFTRYSIVVPLKFMPHTVSSDIPVEPGIMFAGYGHFNDMDQAKRKQASFVVVQENNPLCPH